MKVASQKNATQRSGKSWIIYYGTNYVVYLWLLDSIINKTCLNFTGYRTKWLVRSNYYNSKFKTIGEV